MFEPVFPIEQRPLYLVMTAADQQLKHPKIQTNQTGILGSSLQTRVCEPLICANAQMLLLGSWRPYETTMGSLGLEDWGLGPEKIKA